MQRKIIHVDMDCFFAAVEMRDDPSLTSLPIAVGGAASRRGVLSTCNYVARKFGIRSAMPIHKALQLCPELVILPGRMDAYKAVSKQVLQIFHRYTDIIEPLSLDEAYLDVSESSLFSGSATYIAQDIRRAIEEETGLTASAGVAPCKFIAKVASDENKPNGLCVVTPAEVDAFVASLPLEKIPGVGKVTLEKLHALGLYTCKDVHAYPREVILTKFGKFGRVLLERSQGIDNREVVTSRERKSVGVERTLSHNIAEQAECEVILKDLYQELQRRLTRVGAKDRIRSLAVKMKFADFQLRSAEQKVAQLEPECYQPLLLQLLSKSQGRGIRLLGLSAQLNSEGNNALDAKQLNLI
ncbi:DNA polymerase IV [Motilimonas eburnea]|uniref:DNA polymerase IV n=1 Tax=Motilimonas eburnea TaxID=1737488 RepID=UPI001E2FBB48|nr:DNA polymerase IV [Motilimonas eburnea]MCE2569944.1 DNA polymerase IV [Motilimonas eburnea]